MKAIICTLIMCTCSVLSAAMPDGAPLLACERISPVGHSGSPNSATGESPVTLSLNGLNGGSYYCPGVTYTGTRRINNYYYIIMYTDFFVAVYN